ncbi:acyl-CoA dehydrogenase family protein [Streptomyces sp. NPDC048251]|uniref:acyl-CoA dehydrogenase family protein n=1 Tax=Streptomyces sp. NPDC048251 TaxID=3154501 RepID=UPI003427C90A
MMNLAPSEEQQGIAAASAEFLAERLPLSWLRELAAVPDGDAVDDATWRRCAGLGWLALGLSEDAGGLGLGLPEEVMLMRELGRGLAPGPFRSSVLGARVAARSGHTALATTISEGGRRVGMRVGELVIDVRPGDLILELDEAGGSLHEAEAVERVRGIDPGTRFGRAVPGTLVARLDDAGLIDRARVLVAAELLGIAEAVRDMSAEYARTRVQFGKAIGSFQAVKHRCADMAVAAYVARAQIFQAALLVEAAAPDAAFHAASAYVLAVKGAKKTTADNIQNHGGIGYTWEHDAHLYLKRALLLEHLLGTSRTAYQAVLAPARHEF